MTDSSRQAIHMRLARLREDLLDSLPTRQTRLRVLWTAAISADWSAESLAALHHAVHGLCGIAKTHGLRAIGDASAELDECLASQLENRSDTSAASAVPRTETLFEKLLEAFQEPI